MASSYIGKPCPKCAHVRTASETAPDWQCPKCGIVYAKFGQEAPAPAPASVARRPAQADSAASEATGFTGMAKLAHLSSLANYLLPPLGTIVAIAIWIMKSGEDEFAVDAAKEAINFQISSILFALAIFLMIVVFPPLFMVASLFLVVYFVACIVMPIIATVRVSEGMRYYYPYILHIFGDGPNG